MDLRATALVPAERGSTVRIMSRSQLPREPRNFGAPNTGVEPVERRLNLEPPDPDVPCCMTSMNNPDDCSCWRPVLVPHPSLAVQAGPSPERKERCEDCAYRRDSPERAAREGDPLPYSPGHTFYCHDEMPRIWAWVHPSGVVALTPTGHGEGDYRPTLRDGRAWRADGRPALVCAGWAAENRRFQTAEASTAVRIPFP